MKERPKKNLWQEFKKNPPLYIGLFLVFVLLLMAFFPSLFTSLSPTDIVAEAKLSPPSKEHIFGTDVYGRDVFARCVYGTIVDLKIGVIAMIVPLIMGTIIGLLAGYYGGKFDMIVMRIVDIFTGFPFMVLVIAIVAILGTGLTNLYIAIWCVGWKEYARLVRSEVLVVKRMEYIDAARTMGFRDLRIILRHILPNCLPSLIVLFTLNIPSAILSESSLSFLGVGAQPPSASWGLAVTEGKRYLFSEPWVPLAPSVAIMILVMAFNFLGDGLRDVLDPYLKEQ